jgi:hypothetical protein
MKKSTDDQIEATPINFGNVNNVSIASPDSGPDDIKRSRSEPITVQQFKAWMDGYIAGKNYPTNIWTVDDIKLIKSMSDRITEYNYSIPYSPMPGIGAPYQPTTPMWIGTTTLNA